MSSIIPSFEVNTLNDYLDDNKKEPASRTFEIDWENNEILPKHVDGCDSVEQSVKTRIYLEWLEKPIMPDTFGFEYDFIYNNGSIPVPRELILGNIERLIREAIKPDLRITKMRSCEVEEHKGYIIVYLELECTFGSFSTSVRFDNV